MTQSTTPIAIVGVGAILPDAPDVATFWRNLEQGRYSISDVRPDRWDPDLYYDPDPKAPERTYSKIGGWVRQWEWTPLEWHLPIPPKVGDAMDDAQKWAVACTHAALTDYGWPQRKFDSERTAVILGNAMGGEQHYRTSLRISFPEVARGLAAAPSFTGLPADLRAAITAELHGLLDDLTPEITEDTMPGELGNCIAGRVANLFNLHGPNFIVDAACASAMAAFDASIAGLAAGEFDIAISGGVDRNMGAATYVKFCKIGALSATGTRPFDAGADGFVMGEGAALFVLKRLADAERDDDRIYAVVRGIGGASDGRGKGITAPNPVGQRLAVERAWRNAGLSPEVCSLVEAHGTSTRVGDVVETSSIAEAFASADIAPGSIALGSVKSNIGHLKAAAGAAGLLKATLALHAKSIPPSLGFRDPNPNIDWATSPFHVNTELTEWKVPSGQVRCAGVSAFGFGGTNFHTVLEEYVPGLLHGDGPRFVAVGADLGPASVSIGDANVGAVKVPLRGALVLGAATEAELGEQLRAVQAAAEAGRAPAPEAPMAAALGAPERIAIDYGDAAELADKATRALDALARGGAAWKLLQGRGIFRGRGPAGKVAFLYTGQGSQYANMLGALRVREPAVAATFAEADEVMTPLLGRPLTDVIFVDPASPERMAVAEEELQRTEITQPAVLAVDIALTRLLAEYDVIPDMVMGHSLGEYGALVAAGSLSFAAALEAVSARGHEMAHLSIDDPGLMVAVMGPLETVEEIVASIDGNVVLANVNSTTQSVIGGATEAVLAAEQACAERGLSTARLPVSHAFHTSIVAPASEPLRRTLERLELRSPVLPIVANVTGDFYPSGPDVVPEMLELLARQVAAPVQFVAGLNRLADAGARVFVEVGPKWALRGFAADVLGDDRRGDPIATLATNHPKAGDIVTFNQALCGLYAAGLGGGRTEATTATPPPAVQTPSSEASMAPVSDAQAPPTIQMPVAPASDTSTSDAVYLELGHMFADFLDRSRAVYAETEKRLPADRGGDVDELVVITGAALGTPGTARIFDDANLGRLLNGEQFIEAIPMRIRNEMVEHRITRVVKSDHGGSFERIDSSSDVLKLAARGGAFDFGAEFGVDADRVAAYGRTTQLAIGAGFDALRDAGIPLVMRYKTTHLGTYLPERWGLPDELRDETGVIFASAFPGIEEFAAEARAFAADQSRREERAELEVIRARLLEVDGADVALAEIDRRLHDLGKFIDDDPYGFDRRFLLRVLAMGHSQFADLIGARGPNTQINSACASTTQAISLAQDWIRAGRCRRVVVIAADDVTSDELLGWFGSGFLATGAAATDEDVTEAAIPFDRRRHGMILGMGAAALVVERADAARERGLQPICEVLGTATANSAFHGTRLDVDHIGDVMEQLVAGAEVRSGIDRHAIAPTTVFMSHETYTPARGGSASAEIFALRRVFGADADRVVIANTKGFTGHPMAVGLEDVVAVKALETGIVPPVANYREPDPELGPLNLSKGGSYPVEYAIRLGAGFGSQISMVLLRRTPAPDGQRRGPDELGYVYRVSDPARFAGWLARISGDPAAEFEVVQRRLRLVDHGPARTTPAPPPPATVAPVLVPAPADLPAVVPVVEPVIVPVAAPAVEPLVVPVVAPVDATIEAVADRIVALVAEQTGYPAEMLALDLDLEADLGIDTVKQAELFAKIREEYGIERDDKLKLRDYPTLNHVLGFVRDRTPHTPTTQPAPPAPVTEPVVEPLVEPLVVPVVAPVDATIEAVADRIVALVAEQTGYPAEMLALDLDLEADLGIDTVKQAELFAKIREEYGIERDDKLKLRDYPTLNHVLGFVRDRTPHTPTTQPAPPAPVTEPVVEPLVEPLVVPVVAPVDATIEAVADRIVALVAEQTGYPAEMLALDLDLEADLGIDTVKQAELFAKIREEYGIERDDKLKLRDYPTLNHVLGFVRDRTPHTPTTQPATPKPGVGTVTGMLGSDGEIDAFPRRVPVVVLRPGLEQCAPTGVTLDTGSRVFVMADAGGAAAVLVERLRQRGVETLVVDDAPEADELVAGLASWRQSGPITGVYWLPALDDEGPHDALDPDAWKHGLRRRVKLLAAAMRELYSDVALPGTFFVSATRLGGLQGYGPAGASAPMGGAVSGFTKAYARERADALVKSVDFGAGDDASFIAEHLLAETLHDPGAVEIGHFGGQRWSVALVSEPVVDGGPDRSLTPDSVFVITGAAGSIVSAITSDLAVCGGTFHLLDLVAEPDPADTDLVLFVTDRDRLKRELAERIAARGERATPALVERELARLERAKAAADTIDAVRRAGGTARWHQVDLTDSEAVDAVLREVRADHTRVDVLLHAAGVEISHTLDNKPTHEYDTVFDVKCDGWFNLLHGLGDHALGTAVVFSSIAGRFGNAGQTDYSAANDLLCKSISNFRTARPESRGIAIDWTAWASIGMASRGSIPKMMALAGIDMLPPEVGVPVVRREITAAGRGGEVVVAGSLGMLVAERDGLDPQVARSALDPTAGPMLGAFTGWTSADGLAVRITLDPVEQSFLDHHRIDGTPVLPGVMGIEGFAEVASALATGWTAVAVEDVAFLAPCKFYRNEPRDIDLMARPRLVGDDLVADSRLLARRSLPNQPEQLTTHFTGRVRLARAPAPARTIDPVDEPSRPVVVAREIYRIYFHGPAYQVVDSAWRDGDRVVGLMADDLPPDHQPDGTPLLVAPRLIELCFQTAGILELGTTGRLALPLRVGSVSLFPVDDPVGRWRAVVTPRTDGRGFDAVVVDDVGQVRVGLDAYETIALPGSVDDDALGSLREAMR